MNLTFSAHALNRCLERDISLQRVADAILAGEMDCYGNRRILTHGRLRVVVLVQGDSCFVVTAFRLPNQNPKRARQKRGTFLTRYEQNKKPGGGAGLRRMPGNIHNEVNMQQNTSSCQLSPAEKRILAEAEFYSQRKRLHDLIAECAEAQRAHAPGRTNACEGEK